MEKMKGKVGKSGKKGGKLDIKHVFLYEYGQKQGKNGGKCKHEHKRTIGQIHIGQTKSLTFGGK